MSYYECADCGWQWPYPTKPNDDAECDTCGGGLFSLRSGRAMTTNWMSLIADVLVEAEKGADVPNERFIGFYNPEEPYLLIGEIAAVLAPVIEKALAVDDLADDEENHPDDLTDYEQSILDRALTKIEEQL